MSTHIGEIIDQIIAESHSYEEAGERTGRSAGSARIEHEGWLGILTCGPMFNYLIAQMKVELPQFINYELQCKHSADGAITSDGESATNIVFSTHPKKMGRLLRKGETRLAFDFHDGEVETYDALSCSIHHGKTPDGYVAIDRTVWLDWWNSHKHLDDGQKTAAAIDDLIKVVKHAFGEILNCPKDTSAPAYTEENFDND